MRFRVSWAFVLVACGGSSAQTVPTVAPVEPVALRGLEACLTEGAPGVAEQHAASAIAATDPERAAQGYDQACELGNPCGCHSLAYALQTGAGVAVDVGRARALYERACADQVPAACTNVAVMLLEHPGASPEDEARAVSLLEDACEQEVAGACNQLGVLVARSRVREDVMHGMELYGRACDGGEPWACYNLAGEILRMTGSAESLADAHQLFVHACEQNIAPACVAVGRALASGRFAPPDPSLAATFYERSCVPDGDLWGCTFLGQALVLGLGVERDEARGRELLTTACDNHVPGLVPNAVACTQLALLATGVERSTMLAHACEMDDPVACDLVGGAARATDLPDALHFDDPSFGGVRVRVDAGAAETSSEVHFGGDVDVAALELRPSCVGRVGAEPNALVTVGRRVPRVRFVGHSAADSTLVVRDPQGVFHCADDMPGGVYDAEIVLPGRPGDYQVWTGALQEYVVSGALLTSALPAEARP